jgi:uncharacterized protein with GYD domain
VVASVGATGQTVGTYDVVVVGDVVTDDAGMTGVVIVEAAATVLVVLLDNGKMGSLMDGYPA